MRSPPLACLNYARGLLTFDYSIALHSAYTYPGAQVYPSCIQVTVTGSGTKTPDASYKVAFPGAYTASTPGIVYDVVTSESPSRFALWNIL